MPKQHRKACKKVEFPEKACKSVKVGGGSQKDTKAYKGLRYQKMYAKAYKGAEVPKKVYRSEQGDDVPQTAYRNVQGIFLLLNRHTNSQENI